MDETLRKLVIRYQKDEITEHHIYARLARALNSEDNCAVLQQIADDELRHYEEWKPYTQTDVKPDQRRIWWYTLLGRTVGVTFALHWCCPIS